jgi:hypothetical protein
MTLYPAPPSLMDGPRGEVQALPDLFAVNLHLPLRYSVYVILAASMPMFMSDSEGTGSKYEHNASTEEEPPLQQPCHHAVNCIQVRRPSNTGMKHLVAAGQFVILFRRRHPKRCLARWGHPYSKIPGCYANLIKLHGKFTVLF